MLNQPNNATSYNIQNKRMLEQEIQPKIQITELQKQTSILADSRELTRINAETTKQLVECTEKNQISANMQFKASNRLAKVAIWISIVALIINIIQLFK